MDSHPLMAAAPSMAHCKSCSGTTRGTWPRAKSDNPSSKHRHHWNISHVRFPQNDLHNIRQVVLMLRLIGIFICYCQSFTASHTGTWLAEGYRHSRQRRFFISVLVHWGNVDNEIITHSDSLILSINNCYIYKKRSTSHLYLILVKIRSHDRKRSGSVPPRLDNISHPCKSRPGNSAL